MSFQSTRPLMIPCTSHQKGGAIPGRLLSVSKARYCISPTSRNTLLTCALGDRKVGELQKALKGGERFVVDAGCGTGSPEV